VRGIRPEVPNSFPPVDLRTVPSTFDEVVDWLDRWSYGLVLLEEYSLTEIRAAVAATGAAIRDHRVTAEAEFDTLRSGDEAAARGVSALVHDHEWFEVSVSQFRWFLQVVEQDDHGGHRQALGQYGRVLAEALRWHRSEEQELEVRHAPGGRARPEASRNPN